MLTGTALGTIVGTGRADSPQPRVQPGLAAARPVPRRRWPGHRNRCSAARGLAAVATTRPPVPWTPFFAALVTPGTAVEDEPGHRPRVAGVPLNLVPQASSRSLLRSATSCTAAASNPVASELRGAPG